MSSPQKILLGTASEQKIAIVKSVLREMEIIPLAVASEITDQPLDTQTTIQGAKNRAANAIESYGKTDFEYALGMEAGLQDEGGLYYLVCVVAKNDGKGVALGISQKIPLPQEVSDAVRKGAEYGKAIREYKEKHHSMCAEERTRVETLINRESPFRESLAIAVAK